MLATAMVVIALQSSQQWPVGREREVDEGTYMQVVASDQGWRIWRTEIAHGVYCRAVKSARGRPHPVPLGFQDRLFGGTPFLEIRWDGYTRHLQASWQAVYSGRVSVKVRGEGERFWLEQRNSLFPLGDLPLVPMEVVLESWEYPALLVGREEERAVFDPAGIEWAKAEVLRCAGGVGGADPAPVADSIEERMRQFENWGQN
jgi:hypothetical protein